ncbi:MAG: winged helix-turn-helix domain-containing protein [Parvibaculum sp.]|nr:winged helix-turn-helix domain-containing protein [Parvibaculum sp.]
MNNILKDFEAEKLVKTGYRSIKIIDPEGLHRIATSMQE